MRRVPCSLRRFRQQSRIYFSRLRPSILSDNLTMLRRSFLAFPLFLAAYGAVMLPFMHNPTLNSCYLFFAALDLPLLLFTWRYGRTRPASYRMVQGLSHLAIWMLLGFIISLSILPFPDRPGIFYPLTYICVTVLFDLPYGQLTLSLTLVNLLYLILALRFKASHVAVYDVTGAVTAWLLGFFIQFCVTDLRFKNGIARLELEHLGHTDQLTGLYNRRILDQEAASRLEQCRQDGQPAAALMMDVDHFKSYNDTFGHPAGDECLRQVAQVIQSQVLPMDGLAIRFGGEEFLLLLFRCSLQQAGQLADQLLKQVQDLATPVPGGGTLTLSIGGSTAVPGARTSLPELISRADAALYRAKQAGRGCVVFWQRGANPHE